MRQLGLIIALLGLAGVALGAFGAHALREQLATTGRTAVWQTAVFYHLVHSVAAFALLASTPAEVWRPVILSWTVGVLLFSGSLYVLSLGGPRWLGPITPLGGLAFIIGWGWAGWILWRGGALR